MSTNNLENSDMAIDRLKAVLNGLTPAVFIVDKERQVIVANDVACETFGSGYEGENFVLVVRHPDCIKAVDKVLSGKKRSQAVITLQSPVRTTYEVKVTSLIGHENFNDVTAPGAVISFDNISHMRHAEQMRSEFVANVSHELRSPLTVLNGFIETLKGPARGDEEASDRFLTIMEQEAQRMNRLIEDLLSLSKVEVNEHVRPVGKVDICALIEQIMMILAPQAKKERLKIQLHTPDNQTCRVLGDEDQLEQVFLNLIENAIKYGQPDSEIAITISPEKNIPGIRSDALAIAIKDHGPGIPPEHIPRLTERFYRIDNSRSREKGGTGLGLAIVKHILARHRGKLTVKSELGKGSVFTVYLPILSAE